LFLRSFLLPGPSYFKLAATLVAFIVFFPIVMTFRFLQRWCNKKKNAQLADTLQDLTNQVRFCFVLVVSDYHSFCSIAFSGCCPLIQRDWYRIDRIVSHSSDFQIRQTVLHNQTSRCDRRKPEESNGCNDSWLPRIMALLVKSDRFFG
jgi:hypothetical protein